MEEEGKREEKGGKLRIIARITEHTTSSLQMKSTAQPQPQNDKHMTMATWGITSSVLCQLVNM